VGLLVRDNVPEILKRRGFDCDAIELEGDELLRATTLALLETAQLLAFDLLGRPNGTVSRLADLYDVLDLLSRQLDVWPAQVQEYRRQLGEREGLMHGRYLVRASKR